MTTSNLLWLQLVVDDVPKFRDRFKQFYNTNNEPRGVAIYEMIPASEVFLICFPFQMENQILSTFNTYGAHLPPYIPYDRMHQLEGDKKALEI
jgi:hypothetical protein